VSSPSKIKGYLTDVRRSLNLGASGFNCPAIVKATIL